GGRVADPGQSTGLRTESQARNPLDFVFLSRARRASRHSKTFARVRARPAEMLENPARNRVLHGGCSADRARDRVLERLHGGGAPRPRMRTTIAVSRPVSASGTRR